MLTKDEEAIKLARIHYEVEEGMTHIFRMTGTPGTQHKPPRADQAAGSERVHRPIRNPAARFRPVSRRGHSISLDHRGGHTRRVSKDSDRGVEASEWLEDP